MTRLAPASTAAAATSLRIVSMLTTTPWPDQPLDDGDDAAELLVGGDPLRAGPGGLTADVDEVGAGSNLCQGVGHGDVDIDEPAAVGEGVRRDVEHRHDQGAPNTGQRVGQPERVHA